VKTGKSTIDLGKLLQRLHDPLQLRVFLTGLILAVGYVGVYMPLSTRIDETTSKLNKERKRRALAEEIEHLREQVGLFESRLPEDTDTNEWVQYVLGGIRQHPMKVIGLDSDETRKVGPYEAIVLRIDLEGEYRDLDSFLHWLDGNERFFRVDSLRVAPTRQANGRLDMQMMLLGLRR
jgi:Tfp pilus assembly protein PilO